MDLPTSIIPSALEYAYGPVSDSYAQKYNIPADVMRDAIRQRSGFDPNYSSSNGKGIAGLNFTKPGSPNPSDIGSSLDFVGQYLSSVYKQTGDWKATLGDFLGTDEASKSQQQEAQQAADNSDDSTIGKITAFFKKGAFTIIIVLIGLVLILGSSWMIISNKGK